MLFRSDRKSTRLNSSHTLISYAVFRRVLFRSDRKSTRLNSSHTLNSYAVFCLKNKAANGNDQAFLNASARLLKMRLFEITGDPNSILEFFSKVTGATEVLPFPSPASLPV